MESVVRYHWKAGTRTAEGKTNSEIINRDLNPNKSTNQMQQFSSLLS
jgi:hypothetical protein